MSGVIVAAGIGAAAVVYSSSQQADAADAAAETQSNSNAAAIAENRRQFNTTQANYQPFIDTAHRLLPVYESEINRPTSAYEVMNQPGYQFGLSEGQKGIDRRIAAGGGRVSGAAIKAAGRYGTDYATTKYGEANSIREARLSRLGQLAGLSPITAAANSGQQSANAIGGLLSSGGDAAAAAQLARGNIYGNLASSLGAQAQRGIQQYASSQQQQPDANYYNNLDEQTWMNQSPSYGFDG